MRVVYNRLLLGRRKRLVNIFTIFRITYRVRDLCNKLLISSIKLTKKCNYRFTWTKNIDNIAKYTKKKCVPLSVIAMHLEDELSWVFFFDLQRLTTYENTDLKALLLITSSLLRGHKSSTELHYYQATTWNVTCPYKICINT